MKHSRSDTDAGGDQCSDQNGVVIQRDITRKGMTQYGGIQPHVTGG